MASGHRFHPLPSAPAHANAPGLALRTPSGPCYPFETLRKMSEPSLPPPYDPNPLLAMVYRRLFAQIQIDSAWLPLHRRLTAAGPVVHILPTVNFVEFLALDHITKQHNLSRLRYVNDPGLWVLNPMGKGWLNAILPARRNPGDELTSVLREGGSAALFLKRRANIVELATSGPLMRAPEPKEGDRLVRALLALQASTTRPITLVPELFFWTKQPERDARRRDLLLGSPEAPGASWAIAHLLTTPAEVRLRAGEPLVLSEFLAANQGLSDAVLVRRLVYALLRRLGRERRAVIGPAVKAPERVRTEIARSPRLRELIDDLSAGDPAQAVQLRARTLSMLEQLQATPDHHTTAALGRAVQVLFSRIYGGIEVDPRDIERLRKAAREGTLILLPSHKSHVDYLVMSYQLNRLGLPVPMIAAGDNLDFFPMGTIFRRSGAFFIRRTFRGDRLYAAVVDAYVRRLIRDGFAIELYLEGGRSRTGKLLPPKLGLLSMIVEASLAESQRQTFFVPVSIGYERIVETDSFNRELTGGEKPKENAAGLLRSRGVLGHRYGRINLQFGEFLTLGQVRAELGLGCDEPLRPAKRRAVVSRLGNWVMDEINRITAVTPGALTAMVLLSHPQRGLSHEELVKRASRLLELLRRSKARLTPPTATSAGTLRPEAIREALQLFVDGDMVESHATAELETGRDRLHKKHLPAGPGTFYTVPDAKRLALDTTKNIIIHFFVERAMLALVCLSPPEPQLTVAQAETRFFELSTLLGHEFRVATSPGEAARAFHQVLSEFLTLDLLEHTATGQLRPGLGRDGAAAAAWLSMLGAILVNYLEGYRVAARALSFLKDGPLSSKDLQKRALGLGNRMFFAGEISRREAITKPILYNGLLAFADARLVSLQSEQVTLTDAGRESGAVAALEERMASWLRGITS
jgi:glycerol-3-phosphate O-acyltransferase